MEGLSVSRSVIVPLRRFLLKSVKIVGKRQEILRLLYLRLQVQLKLFKLRHMVDDLHDNRHHLPNDPLCPGTDWLQVLIPLENGESGVPDFNRVKHGG